MSLQTRLADYITRVGTEFKALRTLISGSATGDVSGLNTTATNLVAAVNEVKVTADSASGAAGAMIDDVTASATTTYSSNKISADIVAAQAAATTNAVNQITNGAGAAYDTLIELQGELQSNDGQIATLLSVQATKANAADVYTQTELGDPETDLVALFNAALI